MCIISQPCEQSVRTLPLRLHPRNLDALEVNGLAPISRRKAFSVLTRSRDSTIDVSRFEQANHNQEDHRSHPRGKASRIVQLGPGVLNIVEELPTLQRVEQQIPLLFSEVSLAFDPIEKCDVFVFDAPLVKGTSVLEVTTRTATNNVWLFCLEGERLAVSDLMQCFGANGAICNDTGWKFEFDRMEPIAGMPLHFTVPSVEKSLERNACTPEFCVKLGASSLGDIRQEVAMLVAAGRHPNIVRFYTIFTHQFEHQPNTFPSVRTERTSTSVQGFRKRGRPLPHNETTDPNYDEPSSSAARACKRFGFVIDYYGQTLSDIVHTRTLKKRELTCLASGLLAALNHMHRAGVVHCNVHPMNIQMTRCGRPILCGFGCAVPTVDVDALVQRRGSPEILAPEVILGLKAEVGVKIDMFALGSVLYVAACGEMPFKAPFISGVFKAILRGNFNSSHDKLNDVSKECMATVCGLLAVPVSERLNGEDALKGAWLGADHGCCAPDPPPRRSGQRRRTRADTYRLTLPPKEAKDEDDELQRLTSRTLVTTSGKGADIKKDEMKYVPATSASAIASVERTMSSSSGRVHDLSGANETKVWPSSRDSASEEVVECAEVDDIGPKASSSLCLSDAATMTPQSTYGGVYESRLPLCRGTSDCPSVPESPSGAAETKLDESRRASRVSTLMHREGFESERIAESSNQGIVAPKVAVETRRRFRGWYKRT